MVAAVSPLAFIRWASAACSEVSLAGRPNLRPDLRACSSLSAVRSRTSSRSYSAMDIRIPATIRPVLVDVSTPSCSDRTVTPRCVNSWRVLMMAPHVAAQPVQTPDDQGVAFAQVPHALGEARPVIARPGHDVVEYLPHPQR